MEIPSVGVRLKFSGREDILPWIEKLERQGFKPKKDRLENDDVILSFALIQPQYWKGDAPLFPLPFNRRCDELFFYAQEIDGIKNGKGVVIVCDSHGKALKPSCAVTTEDETQGIHAHFEAVNSVGLVRAQGSLLTFVEHAIVQEGQNAWVNSFRWPTIKVVPTWQCDLCEKEFIGSKPQTHGECIGKVLPKKLDLPPSQVRFNKAALAAMSKAHCDRAKSHYFRTEDGYVCR
ncbi:MAG: hypothetical protein WCV73_03650 [Patescibacteria group bacterium]